MRGEEGLAFPPLVMRNGSPPHARGRAAKIVGEMLEVRITPACAGKSCTSRRSISR